MIVIRETQEADLDKLLSVIRAAFGSEVEADLTNALLDDPSARPSLSLLALKNNRPVGHILFTAARIVGPENPPSASLLAPLSVVPDTQGKGVGGRLIAEGLNRLRKTSIDLVFVLGHPDYYPRHGFETAANHGLNAPYPIAEEHTDAWMVQALRPDLLGTCAGTLTCANAINAPEYWQE